MPGCGMEPKHFVSWRTDVFMRKAFAVGEHVKSICAWPSICLSSYPHQFTWRLPHLLYVSSKERVMPKNACLILNSLVQCRISLFCFATGLEHFGSWEITIYFHNLRIGYLDLSRNKSDMPCPCSRRSINVSHVIFVWCQVVKWNRNILFRGGRNFWCAKRLHWKNMWKLHWMLACGGMEQHHLQCIWTAPEEDIRNLTPQNCVQQSHIDYFAILACLSATIFATTNRTPSEKSCLAINFWRKLLSEEGRHHLRSDKSSD